MSFTVELQSTVYSAPCQGDLKIPLRRGGGVTWTPAEGGGGGLEKWGSVSGPLFCVRTDVATKGAGTQILARKFFSTNNAPPPPPPTFE